MVLLLNNYGKIKLAKQANYCTVALILIFDSFVSLYSFLEAEQKGNK